MIVKRYVFFILLLLLVIAPYIATRLCWILSAKETKGKIAFIGKDISAQLPRSYSVVMFSSTGNDTVFFNSADGEIWEENAVVPVLYQPSDPHNASINGFMSLWLDATIYSTIMFVIIAIIFLHPEIVPYRSNIKLQWKKPVISVV
ncbi:hypothetical protein DC498_15970 [Terrimonas sp.]|uniref:DUF3592 domain-containing protein n=1 Tax=Terrimonas sp. TaxID=1914338 RepID=UPI000D5155EF|nr:DUF3592 domain-containing protein [Terrimonas sp.]PVD51148.1 hypothetical protein DC498_15970 [Terrimonas sp.]